MVIAKHHDIARGGIKKKEKNVSLREEQAI